MSLADLALVLMATPLADVDNERISALKRDIIGSHATRTSTELLRVRARIEVHADPK
jgi:hypothetical protein